MSCWLLNPLSLLDNFWNPLHLEIMAKNRVKKVNVVVRIFMSCVCIYIYIVSEGFWMKLPNMDFDADINFLLCESDFTTPNSYSSSSSTSSSSIYDEYSKARVVLSTEQRLKQARIVLEYQQLSDHYDICGSRLQQLTKEIESLRRQNDHLRLTNAALLNLLAVPDTDHVSPLTSLPLPLYQ